MESDNRQTEHGGFNAWDAVPRDGPAVFIIDIARLDNEERLHGRWIDLDGSPAAVAAQVAEATGGAGAGSWAIVDQTGLGTRMVPEDFPLSELPGLRHYLAAEVSR